MAEEAGEGKAAMGVNWSDALFLASVVREMLQGQRHQQDHQLNQINSVLEKPRGTVVQATQFGDSFGIGIPHRLSEVRQKFFRGLHGKVRSLPSSFLRT